MPHVRHISSIYIIEQIIHGESVENRALMVSMILPEYCICAQVACLRFSQAKRAVAAKVASLEHPVLDPHLKS